MKPKRKGKLSRAVARVRAALATAADGAVDAMASYANAPIAAEVDNEKQRWSPLAYVHHQRDLMGEKGPEAKARAEKGRKDWVKRMKAMRRSKPEEYAAFMHEVDVHIDAGELCFILPAEAQEEVRERAAVSAPLRAAEEAAAPYHGHTIEEWQEANAANAAEQELIESALIESARDWAIEQNRGEYPLPSDHAQREAWRVEYEQDITPDLREAFYEHEWPPPQQEESN